jgi:protein phosphatase
VVDSADEFERQGYGRQAARLYFERARGYADPAVICRGPEYLRILYGPEYLLPNNLELLRSRDLGSNRSSVSREFALGIESLEVFVLKYPLSRTH